MISSAAEVQNHHRARALLDRAWAELARTPYVQQQNGDYTERLPDLSFDEAERRSAVGRELVYELNALNQAALDIDTRLSLRLVRYRAEMWASEADWYWLVVDPRGIGSFGLFHPTAYCGGYILNFVHQRMAAITFLSHSDVAYYADLINDYAGLLDQFVERLTGQAARGICMPAPQVLQARQLIAGYRAGAIAAVRPHRERLVGLGESDVGGQLQDLAEQHILPAYDRLLASLSDDYLASAPSTVGISQYEGGAAIYETLARIHTTLDWSVAEIHGRAQARIEEIEEEMRAIERALGAADSAALRAACAEQPEWQVDGPDSVARLLDRQVAAIEPLMPALFATLPEASCGVAPLPATLEAAMTFGFYDPPKRDRARGIYYFNALNMAKQPPLHARALMAHELLPGHHVQFARQVENTDLHPLRRHSFVNAYIEGWAEYAAELAGELGLYETPEQRYGRLIMEVFLTSRLVADTGMNALNWTLKDARSYMRRHSRLTDAEIASETLRYGCDRPGQVLAYKLGDRHMLDLRDRERKVLGRHFDIREFHEAILNAGPVPLGDLDWFLAERRRGSASLGSAGR